MGDRLSPIDLTGDSQNSAGDGGADAGAGGCVLAEGGGSARACGGGAPEREALLAAVLATCCATGAAAAPAVRALVARMPDDTVRLLAAGVATVDELLASAAHESAGAPQRAAALAADRAFAERLDADDKQIAADAALAAQLDARWTAADDAEAAAAAAEEQQEMAALHAKMRAAALDEGARLPVGFSPREFVQMVRPRGAGGPPEEPAVPSVHWRWRDGAWRADERPAHALPYLQVAFIADTHGAHGLLDCYASHPAVADADVLCLCGDVLEHERGPSTLDEHPHVERDVAKWLLAQPQKFKLFVAGNHDEACRDGEAAALRGVRAPDAAAAPRAHFMGTGAAAMYLQDEAAVITLHSGEEVNIYALPWHPIIGGRFQHDPRDPSGNGLESPQTRAADMQPGVVGALISGSWGAVGDRAHVVLCHGPPRYILDSVGSTAKDVAGEPVGCPRLLAKLRAVKPAVVAFGHVHAEQGLRYLAWTKSKSAKAWRAAGRDARDKGLPFSPPPEDAPRKRRVVQGKDLSDVAAAVKVSPEQLAAMQADLHDTLFVNAACMNATTPLVQHGLRFDEPTQRLVLTAQKALASGDEKRSPRQLRPPVVVRVYPGGGASGTPHAMLLPLSVPRFPEW